MPAVKQIAPQKLGRRLVSLLRDILSKGYLNIRGRVSANGVRGVNRHQTEIRRPHELDPPTYQGLALDNPPRLLGSASDIPRGLLK